MRYGLSDNEWATIRPTLPNKARGVPRVDDRRGPDVAEAAKIGKCETTIAVEVELR